MDENNLNTLPHGEETPPAETSGELSTTETADVKPKDDVDVTPDPAKMKAEIEELEKKRRKAEEDAIYWRKEKAAARADYFRGDRQPERQPPPAPEPPGLGQEPKPADFEDYDKYVAALTDYRVKKARVEWEMDTVRKENEKSARQRAENLQVKLQDGYNKYADFEEVAFDRSAIHITPMIVDILADCEHPADLAYYLAKNRVEGVAISRMTPIQAARAIAKIEAKLESTPNNPPPPPPKKPITNAPPPISPLGSGKLGIQKDPEKMTQKEYSEWRIQQGAKRF